MADLYENYQRDGYQQGKAYKNRTNLLELQHQ